MTRSFRLALTCLVSSLTLAACGDDGGGTDTNQTSNTPTTNDPQTTGTDATTGPDGTTADPNSGTDPTTDVPDPTTTNGTTITEDTTTTDGTTTTNGTTITEDTTTTVGDTTTTGGAGLSWAEDVYPVAIMNNCGCHGGGVGALTMTDAIDSYNNIVDVQSAQTNAFNRVTPGEPENSYFLAKIAGTAGDAKWNTANPSQMPKGGPPLPPEQIELVEQWIADGANP